MTRKGKINKIFFVAISIVILAISSIIPLLTLNNDINYGINDKINENRSKNISPKQSANEITIVTPENKTYYSPMSGYYPGTYSFEDTADGAKPKDWIGSGSGYDRVDANVYGHYKAYKVQEYDATYSSTNTFSSTKTSGTVELWFIIDDNTTSSKDCYIKIYQSSETDGLTFGLESNALQYRDNTGWHSVQNINKNQWYHLRVDFESDGGSYEGLNADTWHLYVDGVKKSGSGFAYRAANTGMNKIELYSYYAGGYMHLYVDAVSYSWDPNYAIGDNMQEGLLLSYTNTTTLSWSGYSLDGQANKTILGNTTLSIPANGLHAIQVYGNNSGGTMFNSEKRYFTVNPNPNITILTPENKTYNNPMSGYYPATYGFESDLDGSDAKGWTNQSGSGCTAQIVSTLDGHNKVYQLYDGKVGTHANIRSQRFNRGYGTIEYYVRTTKLQDTLTHLYFYSSDDTYMGALAAAKSSTNPSKWTAWGGSNNDIGGVPAPEINTWYHIRVDFECTTGGYRSLAQYHWKVTINGVEQTGSNTFDASKSNIDYIEFSTYDSHSGYYDYVDAIGFSWDSNYGIGNNSKEGLLLSFTNSTNLSWKGYSLDGQANKTISGNTTILMPVNGLHTIQMYGNDSLGMKHQSVKRYFAVDTSLLINSINITTPENKTYTEPMSGYYPSTYGFESDIDGVTPKDWTPAAGDGYVRVEAGEFGHNKIVRIQEYNGGELTKNTFSSTQVNGTVEFWVKFPSPTDSTKMCYIKLYNSAESEGVFFGLRSNNLQYQDGSGWHVIQSITRDQWYHIRVDFESGSGAYQDLSADTWHLYVDGVKTSSSGYAYRGTNAGMNKIEFYTDSVGYMHFHFDAVSYSWDPDYSIGKNRLSGLLLNYTSTTTLSWSGYSLDGQANKTISGNTTISMPGNGLHTIQVFGNDSAGTMYHSEKRYFTVDYWDTIAPTITGPSGELTLEQFDACEIEWNITEINGGTYKITQNLVEIDSGPFNNWDNVSWIANTTALGDINYTIIATDPFDNIGTRSILIHVVDATNPEISWLTSDFSVFQGQPASFSWRILEHNPTNYAIYDNTTLVKSLTAYQNYTIITHSFLNWTIGQHIFEIRAYDTQGHMSSDQITITVLARPSQYRFLMPNAITCIDWISTLGLYIEFSANASGFLEMHRMTSIFPGIDEVKIGNLEFYYFYNFTIYDADLTENESIIENALIRFYYNPSQVKNPSNLRLYHYIFDIANIIWVWKMCDFIINETGHYIELNSTDFSIFALVEYKLPPGNDDDTTDTKHNKDLIAIIFGDYLVLVVLGAAIGLAVPSAYVIKSRKKKKEVAITDLKEKSKMKRESLLKAEQVSKTGDSKIIKKESSTKPVVPAVPKEPVKAKKAKLVEKPVEEKLSPEQLKEIEKTEKETTVETKEDLCQVHRGLLTGVTYICPKCKTKYCLKCATTLMNNGEKCWSCDTPINIGSEQEDAKNIAVNHGKTNGSEKIINALNQNIPLEQIKELDQFNITSLSEDFLSKLNQLDFDENQKKEFLSEMLALTPEERLEIIDRMIKSKSEDFLG